MTLEQVKALATQLLPQEQLQLVAHICEHLAATALSGTAPTTINAEAAQQQREAFADALLAQFDAVAESIQGESDAAEDLRQIRQERADRL
jgi:hypothetical protein